MQAPPIRHHAVQILTQGFQFTGQLETVGDFFTFINQPDRESLSLYDARMSPLTPGSPLAGLHRPQVTLQKSEIVLIYPQEAMTRASIRTLPRRECLVAYTPLMVCRGYFHLPAEANVRDFLDLLPGDLLPVAEVRIFPLVELPALFPTDAELVLLGRRHIQLYHLA